MFLHEEIKDKVSHCGLQAYFHNYDSAGFECLVPSKLKGQISYIFPLPIDF